MKRKPCTVCEEQIEISSGIQALETSPLQECASRLFEVAKTLDKNLLRSRFSISRGSRYRRLSVDRVRPLVSCGIHQSPAHIFCLLRSLDLEERGAPVPPGMEGTNVLGFGVPVT